MDTRILTALIPEGDAATASDRIITAVRAHFDRAPRLVMLFASPLQPLEALAPAVSAALPGTVVLGASSAGEFTERDEVRGGVSVFALDGDFVVHAGMGCGLGRDVHGAVAAAVEALPGAVEGHDHQMGLVLLDTLAGAGEEASLLATALLGEGVRLVGGAAGDHEMKATQVSLGAQAASDAVVIARLFSRAPLGLGVCNGHAPLSAPLRVTRAEGNVVQQVEGRPAWEVWRAHTLEHARARGVDVDGLDDPADLFRFLVVYEAGLKSGDDYKMRSPLLVQGDGSLAFACGVPQGSTIQIMESDAARQIESARAAAQQARDQLGGRALAGAVVFDCICRKTLLGARFTEALAAMHDALDAPFAGFETYGEVALEVDEMSGFHNTTTVVLAFPR